MARCTVGYLARAEQAPEADEDLDSLFQFLVRFRVVCFSETRRSLPQRHHLLNRRRDDPSDPPPCGGNEADMLARTCRGDGQCACRGASGSDSEKGKIPVNLVSSRTKRCASDNRPLRPSSTVSAFLVGTCPFLTSSSSFGPVDTAMKTAREADEEVIA